MMVQQLPSGAFVALEQGNKIEAIKIVREANGLGLKEAKDLVDAVIAGNESLRMRFVAVQKEQSQKALRWLTVLILIGAAAYYFL